MFRYAKLHIIKFADSLILMKTLEISENRKKIKGCTCKIIFISAAYYPILPALVCVNSSFAIILMGKKELFALLCLSSWCLVIVV